MKRYDLIVLGTGGAGYQVAVKCRKAGWSVAAIDRGPFGGTCSVRGCIPKKVLAGTAEIADVNRRLRAIGIFRNEPTMSWRELIRFKRTFTDPVPERTVKSLRDAGVDVYEGSPRFTGNRALVVGDQELGADHVHVAVGREPARLPIDGVEHLIDSDAFLELDELPPRVLFVGGGYVSFELAHVTARFGASVTVLHTDDRPLPMFDEEIVRTLLEASAAVGIEVELSSAAETIEAMGEGFVTTTSTGATFESDLVIHGAGRVPAIADLDLDATGVDYDERRGISVDDYLRSTSNPQVYAAGDVADAGAPLTPLAGLQGAIVADNLLGNQRKQPDYRSTASVVFTTPAVAKAGLLESEARERGIDFETKVNDLSEWFDSKRLGLEHARSKVLVERASGRIVGAHLIGNRAEDLVNVFSMAIELGLTTEQLERPIFAFPTVTDDLRSMF